jgi:hypothetical protein
MICNVQGQILVGVPGINSDVYKIGVYNGEIWTSARDGIYRIRDDGSAQNVLNEPARQVYFGESALWIIGRSCVYQVTRDNQVRLVANLPQDFDAADVFGNCLWVMRPSPRTVSNREDYRGDAYVVRRDNYQAELQLREVKTFIKAVGRLWFVVDSDSSSKQNNGAQRDRSEKQPKVANEAIYAALPNGDCKRLLEGQTTGPISVAEDGKYVWIWDDKELFRGDGNSDPKLFFSQKDPKRVRSVASVGEVTFIETEDGVFETGGKRNPNAPPIIKDQVIKVVDSGGAHWLFTPSGVYRVFDEAQTDQNVLSTPIISPTHLDSGICLHKTECDVASVQNGFFVRFGRQLFFVKGNSEASIPIRSDLVGIQMFATADSVWVSTKEGIYRVDGSGTSKDEISEPELLSILNVSGRLWLATNMGVHEAAPTGPTLVTRGVLHFLVQLKDSVWVGTDSGLLRFQQHGELVVGPSWASGNGTLLDNASWAPNGSARVHKRKLRFDQSFVAASRYSWIPGSKTYATAPPDTKYIVETDQGKFKDRVKSNKYDNTPELEHPLPLGFATVYISAQDKWNNRAFGCVDLIVLPPATVVPIAGSAAWIFLIAGIVLAAPYNNVANNLIMNPFVRKLGSMYVVPVLITSVPQLRRHLLARYRKEVSKDKELQEFKKGYVLPTQDLEPSKLCERISEAGGVFLEGRSGVGKTAYSRILLEEVASSCSNALSIRGIVPVHISLARVRNGNVLDAVGVQLERYGRITDREVVGSIVQQGGFLFILDGWTELKDIERKAVRDFVEQNIRSSYFCLCSQLKEKEFEQFEHIQLEELSPEKVRAVILKEPDMELRERIFAQFDEQKYALFSLPQDLKLAISIVKANGNLPDNRYKLYEQVLSPIFDSWENAGQGSLRISLQGRAYEMVKTRETIIDAGEHFPEEILSALKDKGLVTYRGEKYRFQHDLIRAFLASGYFVEQWEALIRAEDLLIDEGWRAMLEFACLKINDSRGLQAFMFAILQRSPRIAGETFAWLSKNDSTLIAGWAEAFTLKFGEMTLPGH